MTEKEIFKRYRLIQNIYYQDRVGNKEGFVKLYPNNTIEHELVKCQIALKLKRLGFEIYSECRFSDKSGRADLVAIKGGKGYIVEILHSETEETFELKKEKYPSEFILIKVKTKDFNIEEFEI